MELADLEDAVARALEAQDFETAVALRDRLAELRAACEAEQARASEHRSRCDGAGRLTPEGWSRDASPG